MIAIDLEVQESNLSELGPGYHRKDGEVLCVGLYDGRDYVCCEPEDTRLKDWLASDEDKVFHNSVYDLSWLVHGLGYKVNGTLHDTMTRATLINEYVDVDLDSCCKRFDVKGKNYADTIEAYYKDRKKLWGMRGDVWENLVFLWADAGGREQVIKYNKQDCIATYNLFYAQEPHMQLHREAYALECELQPVILMLNGNGFPVDTVARDNFTAFIHDKLYETEEVLKYTYGITSSIIASPKQLGVAMNELGITSPYRTPTGAQSWSAAALDEIDHPVIEHIQNCKKYNTLLNNFLEGSLQRGLVNGRAYSVFKPNKRDEGGTRTGRFGSATVNLQQIPAREESAEGVKSYGKEIRSMFVPEVDCLLGAFDYSAIEMYGLAHEAIGPKSDIFKEQACKHADFHTLAMELSGLKERTWAKRLNFTVIYGAGPKGIFLKNRKAFKTLENTINIYNMYHTGMPFIRVTCDAIANEARTRGYVVSIGGRVHHKPPVYYDKETGKMNDNLYKMPNHKIQGMCADTLKRGLCDANKAGVYDVLKLHATVHDENIVSIPYNNVGIEAAMTFQRCMEDSFKDRWTVPITTSGDVGPSWGYQKDDIWLEMKAGHFDFSKYEHLVRRAG